MRIENGILFAKLYVIFTQDEILEGNYGFVDFAIEAESINCFYDISGEGQKDILQNKTKFVTCSNMEYVIDVTFKEFSEKFMNWRKTSNMKLYNNHN